MNKQIFSFLKRIAWFLTPFICLILLYTILDPFKVVKKYDSYFVSDAMTGVTLNKDYVSTNTFNKYHPVFQYNSFIFGNSRSLFYEIADWQPHLHSGSNCFHYDASGESLYAIHKKIKYLDRKNVDIKNVLLVFDYSILDLVAPQTSHILMISPQLENYTNFLPFHFTSLKAFFTPKFLIAYIDYKIRGEIRPYMKKGFLLDDVPIHYDVKINEVSFPYFERMIGEGKFYTPEWIKVFYDRDTTKQSYAPAVIFDKQKQMLQEINEIFRKRQTDVKIIISPLYDQIKLNESDVIYLKSLFGEDRLFDFSGISDITNDIHNYYEDSHYRPHVCRQILNSIYQKQNNH